MKLHTSFAKPGLLAALIAAVLFIPTSGKAQGVRVITSSGTTQPQPTTPGVSGVQDPEFDIAVADSDSDVDNGSEGTPSTTSKDRSIALVAAGPGQSVIGHNKTKSNPEIMTSFDGLNFFNQRFANHGNQFSVVPPDQALCAGNGFVLESVNDVLNIYDANGSSLLGVTDLNTFYGYPSAINRTTGADGPSITDPTCHFDPASQRWFHVVLTLERVGTSTALSGKNHLDIAVSSTANPLDPWTVFHLPAQNDGTDGTPDHNCVARVSGKLVHGPCLADYPHIGMDANGLYITTNEFNLFASGFHGSQIYAISKRGLTSGGPANVVQFDTAALSPTLPYGIPGFTVWGALSPGADFDTDNGGTEFLLSSLAVFSSTGAFNQLVQWTLSNTSSLDAATPSLNLNAGLVDTQLYAVPPVSHQKPGDFPLGQCLEDGSILTPAGAGCWHFFVARGGPFTEHETELPSNDSRIQQVFYANGKLWSALDTDVSVGGQHEAGVAWFVLNPHGKGKVVNQGILALSNDNLTYPTIAVNPSGRGVIGFTVVGPDDYPSPGYASLDALAGAGDIHLITDGAGPDDGFSAYPQLTAPNPRRPRWGDYGAAAVDGNTIWFANEYTAQTCNLSQFVQTTFTCGNTRGSFGNWATRITHVSVQ